MSANAMPRLNASGALADHLLDVHEAAAMLAVRPATLYAWAYKRRLPVVKLFGPRGALRFRLIDLQRVIAQGTRPALGDRGSRET